MVRVRAVIYRTQPPPIYRIILFVTALLYHSALSYPNPAGLSGRVYEKSINQYCAEGACDQYPSQTIAQPEKTQICTTPCVRSTPPSCEDFSRNSSTVSPIVRLIISCRPLYTSFRKIEQSVSRRRRL